MSWWFLCVLFIEIQDFWVPKNTNVFILLKSKNSSIKYWQKYTKIWIDALQSDHLPKEGRKKHTHTYTHSNFAIKKLTSARTKVQDSGKQTLGNLSPGSVWIEMALTFVGFLPKSYNYSLIRRETSKLSASRHILQNPWPMLLKTAPQTRKAAPMGVA